MQSDLPHTLFNKGRKGGKGFEYNENDPAIARQVEANRRAAERRAARMGGKDAPVTLQELFKK